MGKHDYFLLIPPFMVAVFALAFQLIARRTCDLPDAERPPGVGWFALAYWGGTVAMTMDYALRHDLEAWGGYPANVPYIVAGGLYAAAIYARFGMRPSPLVCVGLPLAQLAGYAAFVWWDDLPARVLVMNAGAAVVLFAPVPAAWHRARSRLERAVLALIAVSAVQYVARTLALLRVEGAALTADNYAESLIVKTTSAVTASVGVVIALGLLVGYALMAIEREARTARTDPLTGLVNRRGLDEAAARVGGGSVIVADIDRFKAINDAHGHAAGDRVIAAFAALLDRTARPGDLAARVGGEEFAILMPGAPASLARPWAEAVRVALGEMPRGTFGPERITASFGLSEWRRGEPLAVAMERADAALYAAKREGRDRTMIYREVHCGVRPGGDAGTLAAERVAAQPSVAA